MMMMTMLNRETAVIRECFPTSVLLGSIERPVEPQVTMVITMMLVIMTNHGSNCNVQATCSPVSVESDTIKACICTTDFCRWQKFNAFVSLDGFYFRF